MDGEDPYFKLRPLGPTADDELCSCGAVPLVLMCSLGSNPLRCLRCRGEVPPERVGFSADVAEKIAVWRTYFRAFDTLWLDSGEFEELARGQLTDPRSTVNRRGLEAAALLSETRCAYMYWFQESWEADFEPLTTCPGCEARLRLLERRLVCDGCRIAVFNA
jgi:hypothetical protein